MLIPVEAEVKQLLDIPDEYAVAAFLAVGWPERPFPTHLKRRPVEEFATVDGFSGDALRA